ncbi:lactate utilization protein B [Lunatimonas salinarum]|uniref:lactate utilization protein B n=1 Tax=Lunatimonas salinarum TaxID=1774590 RepID=UPI001ADF8638|nr:lactate utilization protein B [Lunatimonas salinarum]
MLDHAKAAEAFNRDEAHVNWHDKAIWHLRKNRDKGVHPISQWQALRDTASNIKMDVLNHLDKYLTQFEKAAEANGIHVHWAVDASEHNLIVKEILERHHVKKLVKSKSMLTEECHLNPYLEEHGFEIVDTDLGERIIQLAKESPSHITAPAIHKKMEEVDVLFQQTMGTPPSHGNPEILVKAARDDLRKRFMHAGAAITGVNFAIAESGGFVVCTNEGNADMGVHLAPLHIACMGIEKLIPKNEHLGVFLRILARSANGQSITSYSSHFFKPREGQEMHVVILDNGRADQLKSDDFRNSLKCIRCGACMNTCPVYRRSGGHSYGSTIPGPIGAILEPNKDMAKYSSLPFASTLCGSCTDVCPVKIDIHSQLYKWRQLIMKNHPEMVKKMAMKSNGWIFRNPTLYRFFGSVTRKIARILPTSLIHIVTNAWSRHRELPDIPQQSFKEWIKKYR